MHITLCNVGFYYTWLLGVIRKVPMKYTFITLLFVLAAGSTNAETTQYLSNLGLSHSGGTDKCGCHYNKKTGEYHCHTRKQRGGSCPP